jgi:hypothetical protein
MRLRNMFVNILRQIDTRVIPVIPWQLCVSSFKQVNDHLATTLWAGSPVPIPSSLQEQFDSADPPALMSSLLRSAASPALYVGRSATARSIFLERFVVLCIPLGTVTRPNPAP